MSENYQHDHDWHGGKPKPHEIFFGVLMFMLAYMLALAAGYGITALVYMRTGTPPEFIRNMITGFIGILLMIGAISLPRLFYRKFGRERENIHNMLTEALVQIGQGNFNIALEMHLNELHHDLAETINEMAQKLGNLETMRQDFVSNVSHEIQSPLTSIGGFAALLRKDDLTDGQRRHYADIIETESKRLSSLSENLLKLSSLDDKQTALYKKYFRLDKQLENVALMLEPQWSAKNINLEADLRKLTIFADEDLLSQVWVNLLHNAVKFTPNNGTVNITLAEVGDYAAVTISDTGAGISKDDLPHIFERFYKADKSRDRALGGNGLGLSLVKKIVELYGGKVTIESEFGKGSAFILSLPIADA